MQEVFVQLRRDGVGGLGIVMLKTISLAKVGMVV